MANISDPNGYLPEDWQGTVLDMLELDIPAEHRLELALQPGLIDDKTLLLFAVWCERKMLELQPHAEMAKALDVTEKYALGQATLEEFVVAWDGDEFTAVNFAYGSARAYAGRAANHATMTTTDRWVDIHEATQKRQVAHLRDMLKEGQNGNLPG